MKKAALFLLLLVPGVAFAQAPVAIRSAQVPAVTVSPGVILKELTGRGVPWPAHSDKCSVALFWLDPGCATAWSFNKVGEESFFVTKGHGVVWTGNKAQVVEPGSFILVPPWVVRSVRANRDVGLEFYAVTSPAWNKEDDVLTTAPAGAPK